MSLPPYYEDPLDEDPFVEADTPEGNEETDPDDLPASEVGELLPAITVAALDEAFWGPLDVEADENDAIELPPVDVETDTPEYMLDPEWTDPGPEDPTPDLEDEGEEYLPGVMMAAEVADPDDAAPGIVDYTGYEIHGRPEGSGDFQLLVTVEAGVSSAEIGNLPSGEDWLFKVRATYADGTFGPFSPETAVLLPSDMDPPQRPSAPTGDAKRMVMSVKWDGLDSNGNPMVADFERLVVWMANEAVGPWSPIESLREAGSVHRMHETYNHPRYFRFTAFDRTGNESLASDILTLTVRPLVNEDLILEEIDAARTQIVNAGAMLLTTGSNLSQNLAAKDAIFEAIGANGGPDGVARKVEGLMTLNLDQLNVLGTANMKQAVIDKLWTDVVRSRKITTDMMVVGKGNNLVVDPFMDDATVNALRDTTAGKWGTYRRHTTGPNANLNSYGGLIPVAMQGNTQGYYFIQSGNGFDTTAMIPVKPGDKFRFAGRTETFGGGARPAIRFVNTDNSNGWTSLNFTIDGGGSATGYSPAGVQNHDRIYTVPAGVAYISPSYQIQSTVTEAYVFGGVSFTSMADSSLIVDGAIAARHITVTGELTANIAQFLTVKAGMLAANAVEAGTIASGALDSKVITSSTIRSNDKPSTVGGWQLDLDNGLRAWFGNQRTFAVNHKTGELEAVNMKAVDMLATGSLRTGNTGARVVIYDATGSDITKGAVVLYADSSSQRGVLCTRLYNDVYSTHLRHYRWPGGASESWTYGLTLSENTWRINAQGGPNNGGADFFVGHGFGGSLADNPYIDSMVIYDSTITNAANVHISSSGILRRSTSASKYKLVPQSLPDTLDDKILSLRAVDWYDKGEAENVAEMMSREFEGEPLVDKEGYPIKPTPPTLRRIPGLIAEEVEAAGLSQFVQYGEDGEVEGLMYERLGVALIPVVARQRDRITELEERLARIEAHLNLGEPDGV